MTCRIYQPNNTNYTNYNGLKYDYRDCMDWYYINQPQNDIH